MTETDVVRYEVRNGVAWLTIDRPEARNALSRAVREGLFAGVRRFNADDEAKVLVLTGSGDRAFCAGGDIRALYDLGKAGRSRHRGIRPINRGVARNPVDHPNGGGAGKSKSGGGWQQLTSPWGLIAKGLRTRNKKKFSNRFILVRRDGRPMKNK